MLPLAAYITSRHPPGFWWSICASTGEAGMFRRCATRARAACGSSTGIWFAKSDIARLARFSSQATVDSASPGVGGKPVKLGNARARGAHAGQKNAQGTLMYLTAVVVAMVGCTYASVPLYRKFCQATGYGGTVKRRETVEEKIARQAVEQTTTTTAPRELVVQFNADVADGMPWKFTPTQREMKVRPGQSTLAFYTAENNSSKAITGVSTYNITPMKAGAYFNKIQCFCFEEQRLQAGEKIDMPVFFYIDPEFADDPRMNGINNLILSYTFFKVEDESEKP